MSLMYCYAIIIFMVIVNSNSFENYRIIDTKFVKCEYDCHNDNYLCYSNPENNHPKYLNQKLMDPEDFYLTLYNPYFYFFYHSDIINDKAISYTDFIKKRDDYLEKKYEWIVTKLKVLSLKAAHEDIKYTGYVPKYWFKRPQFFELNRLIAEFCNIYKLIYMYKSELDNNAFIKYKREIEVIKNKLYEPSVILNRNVTVVLDIKDITMRNKLELLEKMEFTDVTSIDKKFYKINEIEYNVLLNLMAFLPKVDEHVAYYLKRYFISVYSLLYINVNFVHYMDTNEKLNIMSKDRVKDLKSVKIMSKDRVKNLKSPYLMLRESYNCYVLRMNNLNVMPFHINFFKKKYNLFEDNDETKTIFDEFGVNFKEIPHQELKEERVGQSSESG